jgi:hypothetical protein
MSDSLGDGAGDSTEAQARLYERWAQGGTAVSIIDRKTGGREEWQLLKRVIAGKAKQSA